VTGSEKAMNQAGETAGRERHEMEKEGKEKS